MGSSQDATKQVATQDAMYCTLDTYSTRTRGLSSSFASAQQRWILENTNQHDSAAYATDNKVPRCTFRGTAASQWGSNFQEPKIVLLVICTLYPCGLYFTATGLPVVILYLNKIL